jgi:hypothetical protein
MRWYLALPFIAGYRLTGVRKTIVWLGKSRTLLYRGSLSGNHWQVPSSTNWLFAAMAARE